MPPPLAKAAHVVHPLTANVACKQGPEPFSPHPHRLVADIDPALKQQVLTFLKLRGNRTYISTTRRITSGDELKWRNGDGGRTRERRGISRRYQPPALTATLV
ncbi:MULTISPECIES: hypothetical protein [unclassified Sphingomonas]|uniref:hypothetical protein n=1 Tax=unclassified Sphingomonas TaxID=196159 RepID=UPI00226AAA8A|nr:MULTISPECIES: hypothetical protein [unclassified Sphingomonas]